MEDEKTRTIYKGLDYWDLLSVALIVLRLCGVISWSWVLILLPAIIGLLIDACVTALFIYIVKKLTGER